MEVTLQTEVEAGASGFSVTGGGTEGIFIKKVLKESPASKIFSLREGTEKELSESISEETPHISGKAISEEDRETLIVSQRVGRSKRPKKDRLSWPKFQSIKNKKILGHRRSHSTSDAYEPAIHDASPTSTDTESQFQQEVHIKEKKGSQKKLKFPSIGFKMHRS
ncbi:AHNK2 protein, partial [Corythaeola cristata]|nr:AHNK2 protein [Corythaeola cristata]